MGAGISGICDCRGRPGRQYYREEERTAIDEIKGVYMDLQFLEEPVLVHKAQAMCYAYFYASQNHLEEIRVQMTYCHLESEEIKRFQETFPHSYLKKWFEDLINEYYKWAEFQYRRRIARRESMEGLEFPYPYREGQRSLVSGVYHTMAAGRSFLYRRLRESARPWRRFFPPSGL